MGGFLIRLDEVVRTFDHRGSGRGRSRSLMAAIPLPGRALPARQRMCHTPGAPSRVKAARRAPAGGGRKALMRLGAPGTFAISKAVVLAINEPAP